MKICMIVPEALVKGGIASVVNGYREYDFKGKCEITFVESYCDGNKWKKLCKAMKGYFDFIKVIFNNCPDAVHIHSSFGPSFYRKLPFIYMASWRRIPVINHIHGAEFDTFYLEASNSKKRLIQKAYHKCSRLIALSEEWKSKLSLIVPESLITVIKNYCIIPNRSESKRKQQILFMGEIGQRKGCFDIPDIYQKIINTYGTIPLVMAGDGAVAEIKEAFEEKGIRESVSFPGWVRKDAKDKLLRESSIFLFPSYHEGMPMVVLEAMAYGMAIVTTQVGGIPELIEDGVSGYLCKPGDTEALSDRVGRLLQDKEQQKSFGEAARKKAMECYSIDRNVDMLISVYGEMVRKTSQSAKSWD